jgi:hypothetical protein
MAFTHGKATKVYASGYDLSAFLNSADISGNADMAETSTFGSVYKSYVAGLIDGKMSLAGYFDSAVGGVDELLSPLLSQPVVMTVLPQGDVKVARGRAMSGVEVSYGINASLDGAASITMEATTKIGGVEAVVVDTIKADKTATGNDAAGVISPTAAPTTGGWAAYLHCFSMAGTNAPTCAVVFQDSADDSSWLDVDLTGTTGFVTLSAANANVPGGQRIVGLKGATLRKYTRFLWTIAGTDPHFVIWCGHVRG